MSAILSVDPRPEVKIEIPDQPIRLNVGSGYGELHGYINIDRKNGQEAYPLPYENESVDEVRASHIIEHFDQRTAPKVIADWVRVLKPGGKIKIATVNLDKWAEALRNGVDGGTLLSYLYGGQIDEGDYHKTGFNEAGLEQVMRANGLIAIEEWQSEIKDCASLPISLNLQGIKPSPISRSCCMIMSSPRLLMKHNILPILDVAVRRKIPLYDIGGAYWHHGIERMFRKYWDEYEWIFTVDYDTLFNTCHFDRLTSIFERTPQADALAGLQARREVKEMLAGISWCDDEKVFDGSDAMRSDHAHFGFTLFRSESLKKFAAWCKDRNEPMMQEIPGKNLDFGDDRVDADMNFWHRFKQADLNLYSTPNLSVGHIEEVGAWPTQNFSVMHQSVREFQERGTPKEARK